MSVLTRRQQVYDYLRDREALGEPLPIKAADPGPQTAAPATQAAAKSIGSDTIG